MPLLSNLARVRQERKERWRGGVWSAFVVVEERCLPEESLSPATATSDQHLRLFPLRPRRVRRAECSMPNPTCSPRASPTNHCTAASCVSVYACTRCTPAEGYDLLFLVLFCDCVDSSVNILLLLTLVLSVEVVASLYSTRSALSSPFR